MWGFIFRGILHLAEFRLRRCLHSLQNLVIIKCADIFIQYRSRAAREQHGIVFPKNYGARFFMRVKSQLITCMKRAILGFIQFSLTVALVFCCHFRSTCMWCLLSTFLFVCIFAYSYEVLCTFRINSFIVHIWTKNSFLLFFLTSPQNCHSIISFWT